MNADLETLICADEEARDFARERLAVSNLQRGLAQTNRRWNALDSVILPGLARELADIAGALAEEERDDDFRRRRHRGPGPASGPRLTPA